MSVVPYSNGYSYRRKVTTDHTKVSGSANISNFILYFSITDGTLKDTSHGGNVVNSTYLDIRVEDTSGTHLQQEISFYDGVNGIVRGWVKIPTLSYTADTVFYMYYGKTISATEDDRASLWTDWGAVHHFEDYGLNSQSSSDAYNFSSGDVSGATKVTNTPVGAGYSFDGVNDFIYLGNYSRWSYKITYSVWIKTSTSGQQTLFINNVNATKYYGIRLAISSANTIVTGVGNGTGVGSTNRNTVYGTTKYVNDGNWHKIDVEMTGYNSNKIYVDGVADTIAYSGTATTIVYETYSGSNQARFGLGDYGPYGDFPFNGVMSQFKTVNGAIPYSADYLKTEYNNQIDHTAFNTYSDEEFVAKEDISGNSFIQYQNNVTLYGLSRIEKSLISNVSGLSRIEAINDVSILGNSNIYIKKYAKVMGFGAYYGWGSTGFGGGVKKSPKTVSKVISGIARIEKINDLDISGISRIETVNNTTIAGNAYLYYVKNTNIYGEAIIDNQNDLDISGNSRIEIVSDIAIVGISKISNPKPDKLPAIWVDNSTKVADNWSETDKKDAIWVISNVKKVNEWSDDNDKTRSNWTDSDDKKETDWRRNYYE